MKIKTRAAQRKILWFLLMGFFVMLTGCLDEEVFTQRYRPPRIRPKPQKKLVVKKKPITFIYSPVGKRDPFRPTWLTKAVRRLQPRNKNTRVKIIKRQKTPLEKFELDQLKVVAIVTGVANPVAMVEDPDGRGYMVRRGTLIGRNNGQVTRINVDGVVVSEVFRDFSGKRVITRVRLRMKKANNQGKGGGTLIIGGRKIRLEGNTIKFSNGMDGAPPALRSKADTLFRGRSVGAQ